MSPNVSYIITLASTTTKEEMKGGWIKQYGEKENKITNEREWLLFLDPNSRPAFQNKGNYTL